MQVGSLSFNLISNLPQELQAKVMSNVGLESALALRCTSEKLKIGWMMRF